MMLRYIAPMALLLLAACGSDLTTAAGPGAGDGATQQVERDGQHAWPPRSGFRRPSYPRRDT